MKQLILLIVVILVAAIGYFGYSCSKAKQLQQQREGKIRAAEQEIAKLTEESEAWNQEISTAEQELKNLEQQRTVLESAVQLLRTETEAAQQTQKELQSQINRIQEELTGKGSGDDAGNPDSKITKLQSDISDWQEKIKELDCHYNCMKTSLPEDEYFRLRHSDYKRYLRHKKRDKGEWLNSHVWRCYTHHYKFQKRIAFIDYSNQSGHLKLQIQAAQKEITALQEEKASETSSAQERTSKLTAQLQELKNRLQETGNAFQEKKSELSDKQQAIEQLQDAKTRREEEISKLRKQISSNESSIEHQKQIIAENQPGA